ncbi:MAG: cytochrome c oxidase accessory protein CcoG [Proteobacteria bacterium]|nr:MAG: cytochrome c oxidase accessory protein CcoG [Pseudomonadota bacterium]
MSEAPLQFVEYQKIIEPRSVKGRFRNIKTAILILGYLVFFLLPWMPWSREVGPNQMVAFDLSTHKYYLFNQVFNPQDILSLAALLFFAAVFLFFVTTIAGRIFCGFFCFQTLWTDAFRLIERRIQGDRVARLRLKKQPWSNKEKLLKVGATHVLWVLLAFWTGLTFTLYWAEARVLIVEFFTGQAPLAAYFATLILTVTTYLAAGAIKDAVCVHICPYSRFQSAMFDENTSIVSYDYNRGEGESGRAKPAKAMKTLEQRHELGHGDCVDCNFCVQVCPMGIDIRNGLQIACIHCGLCIDACDTIMDKHKWSRGLIRYTSENALEGKKTSYFGVRTVGYGIATLAAAGVLFWSVLSVQKVTVDVSQVRNPLFVVLSDGSVQNSYRFKYYNKTMKPATFNLSVEGVPDGVVDLGKLDKVHLGAGKSLRMFVRVRQPESAVRSNKDLPIRFKLTPITGEVEKPVYVDSQFITP